MLVCDGRLCFIPHKGRHLRPKIVGVPLEHIFILPRKQVQERPVAVYIRPVATAAPAPRKPGWPERLVDRIMDFFFGDISASSPSKSTWHVIDELDSFREVDELAR